MLGNIPYNTAAYAIGAGYQLQLNEKHRLLFEYHIYEGATDAASDLSKPSNEVLIGYRYHMKRSAIEISMIENVFNMDNSTDIALHSAIVTVSDLQCKVYLHRLLFRLYGITTLAFLSSYLSYRVVRNAQSSNR